jgi:acrylyl-CoA reductase (NADPH)
MNDTMRAYVLEGTADAPRGAVKALPASALPPGDVTIRVEYSGINYKDAMVHAGVGKMVRKFPHVPGIDLAGKVVGDTSSKFKAGAEVLVTGYDLGVGQWGGFADYARVPAGWVVPLPQGLQAREAMAIGTAGFTAMLAVLALERNGLTPASGPVLVTGATGGVGCLAVDILTQAGYRVAASSGKPDMREFLAKLGANDVLTREQVLDSSGKPMLKEQWAAAVDNVGGSTLEFLLRSVQYTGSVALTGLVHGHAFASTVYPFILRGVNLLGIDSVQCPMERRLAAWKLLAGPRKPPHLKDIARDIALDELPAKLQEILGGGARGRFVVKLG